MAKNRKDYTIEEIAETYIETLCNLSATAKALGVSRRALTYWKEEEEELREALEEAEETLKDKLEATALQRALGDSDKLLIFLLEKKCRDRGYSKEPEPMDTGEIVVKMGDLITPDSVEGKDIYLTAEEYSKYKQLQLEGKAPATEAELRDIKKSASYNAETGKIEE